MILSTQQACTTFVAIFIKFSSLSCSSLFTCCCVIPFMHHMRGHFLWIFRDVMHHIRGTLLRFPYYGTCHTVHHFRGVLIALLHEDMYHIRGSIRKFYAWFNVPVTWVRLVSYILLLCAIYVVHISAWFRCSCFSDVPFTWCIVFLLLTMGHLFDVPHSWYTNSSLLSCLRPFRYHFRGAFLWLSGNKLSFFLTSLGPTYVVHLDSISCTCLFQMSHLREAYLRIFNYFLMCTRYLGLVYSLCDAWSCVYEIYNSYFLLIFFCF